MNFSDTASTCFLVRNIFDSFEYFLYYPYDLYELSKGFTSSRFFTADTLALKCTREIKETNGIRLHPKDISTENTGRLPRLVKACLPNYAQNWSWILIYLMTISERRKVFLLPHSIAFEPYVKAFQFKILNSILNSILKVVKDWVQDRKLVLFLQKGIRNY